MPEAPEDVTETEQPRHDPAPRASTSPSTWVVGLVAAVVAVAIAFVGVWIGASKPAAASTTAPSTITVTGMGLVHGTPDTVNFGINISTTRTTAQEAFYANDVRVATLERVLKRYGVTRAEMSPSGLNIYEITNASGAPSGFVVTNTLNVTLSGVDKAGAAIEAAARVARGGLTLTGISFSISNQSRLLAAARSKAIQNARVAAGQIAEGADTSVGSIVSVTDHEYTSQPPVYFRNYGLTDAAYPAVPPVEAGSQALSVQVTVVYTLSS